MTDLIYHSLIYAAIVIILAIIAYIISNWTWFIAAAAGWGVVLIGQAAYVFLWEARGGNPLKDPETAHSMANEARQITPGA